MDLYFYFSMALMILKHSKPEVIQHAKQPLLAIRDFVNMTFPGE